MKQFNFNTLSARLIILTIIASALIFNSCRKDSKLPQQPTITDPAISQAKAWYESVYIANTNVSNLPVTRGITSASNRGITRAVVNQKFDFTQHITPDWKNAVNYTRLKKNVVEIPVDPGAIFGLQLKDGLTGKINLSKKYSRTSFLLLNNGKKYTAYIMVVMADSAYIGNDLKKLSHNTYRHHDPDFSGAVLYFTPKGQYVNGFTFRNGQLLLTTAVGNPAATNSTQSGKTRAVKLVRDNLICMDWYADYYVDGAYLYSEFLGTTCDGSVPTVDPAGGGSGGGMSDGTVTVVDEGMPVPSDPGIFGLNNSNAVVPDANFDNLLSYAQNNAGLSITDPIGPGITYNGTFYPGQVTYIYMMPAATQLRRTSVQMKIVLNSN